MIFFIGVKNNSINVISDKPFESKDLKILKLVTDEENITPLDILTKYKINNNKVVLKKPHKKAPDLKVAFVGNWKMQCGISTYSDNLWGEVSKLIGNFKLFIENNPDPIEPFNNIGGRTIDSSNIVECWKRGESTQMLVEEIKKYDPDIVWIQHEFGLWSNASHWLSLLSQLADYRVIVTMHSVFHHKDKTVSEAAIPEIVVHLQGGADVLKNEKQIASKVYVIPHGSSTDINTNKLWNTYKSEHTIVQFGFGFPYKGYSNSIRATAFLKKKYPNVFFTGLISESPFNKVGHQLYYNELIKLIEELEVQENVALIRGFQSDITLDSYLRTNKIALFPYISHLEHEVWGASGAARYTMTKNIPVISSNVNHFSDVPTIKADTPEKMAVEIEKLFSNKKAVEEQLKIQNDFLHENSWQKIAQRYIKLFENE